MTLYQFIVLSEIDQAEIVWSLGVRLGERRDDQFKYSLYQIDGFYVEVSYHSVGNKIESFTAFNNTKLLEPYLEQIEKSHLD